MWIRTGNVNVANGNGTVNGGTSTPNFRTQGAKPGYIFLGPDGKSYEILTVPSETQITITPAYSGTSANNQAYAIIQLSFAAQADLLQQVQNLLTELSTTITANDIELGAPTETNAVLAALGALVSFEGSPNLRAYFSKNALGGDVWIELSVAKSGRARLGLIANANIRLDYSADGTTWTNVFTVDVTTAPTNPRVTWNVPVVGRSYTLATLPVSVAGAVIYVTDLGGGAGYLRGDGTGWVRQDLGYATDPVSAAVTHNELVVAGNIRLTGTVASTFTITLGTTNARVGARRRYTRTGGGAGLVNIGTLKGLATNTWADIAYDGSAWYLSAYGAL